MTTKYEITVYNAYAPYPQPVHFETSAKTEAGYLRAIARAAVNACKHDAFGLGAIFAWNEAGHFAQVDDLTPRQLQLVHQYASDYFFNLRYS